MAAAQHKRVTDAVKLAVDRIILKGSDDIFKPPVFAQSVESEILKKNEDDFRKEATSQSIKFLNTADLDKQPIGLTRKSLITKDTHSFRQVAWLDPFDAVKYLATACLLFKNIEAARIPKEDGVVHSHRMSDDEKEIFDSKFGYDSFRAASGEMSRERVGQWKVITDIANFFDRIGNHTLENHLKNIGCEEKYVSLVREMLYLWAGDRRSFGVPVGSDASRILSEAVLLNVDKKLTEGGIAFVRYVDDFRLFSETRAGALKAVEVLTSLLADEGLSLNSRKTEIYQIVEVEEVEELTNRFVPGEHSRIDIDEKIEVKRSVRVSGKSSVSRFYREPGKEALKKIREIPKETVIENFLAARDSDVENQIRLVMKYFIYADQDTQLLKVMIARRITSIFYMADALVKEHDRFSPGKCIEIRESILAAEDWKKCAYPLQIPIIRLMSHRDFKGADFVWSILDGHLQSDNKLFYREAISLGWPCLDRARLRHLALEVFDTAPAMVQRCICSAIVNHPRISRDERRALVRNMKSKAGDWFVSQL